MHRLSIGLAVLLLALLPACRQSTPNTITAGPPTPAAGEALAPIPNVASEEVTQDPATGQPGRTCFDWAFAIPQPEGSCPDLTLSFDALAQRLERGWIIGARQMASETVLFFVLADDGTAHLISGEYGSPIDMRWLAQQTAGIQTGTPPEGLLAPDNLFLPAWIGAVGTAGDLQERLGWATAAPVEYPMVYQPVAPGAYMTGPEGNVLIIEPGETSGTWRAAE